MIADDRVRLSSIEQLGATLAAMIDRVASAAGLSHSQAYRLRLATEEIATNIVTHGYGDRGGVIEVDGGVDDDWVWVRLEDTAPEFDPTAHDPTPRLALEPHLAPLGGFGLFLALSSVDRLVHTYTDGRNRNVLLMRREQGGSHGEVPRTGSS